MSFQFCDHQPNKVNMVAMISTIKTAPDNCHDGTDDQNGPAARVMKINQFSVNEICKNKTPSIEPKFWIIPPFGTNIVVKVIQVPTAKITPKMTDIPHNLGKFHLTGFGAYGALS
ncbi:hypothetical protein WICMUC_003502 [Wickerhamomyces mucosus]|uniref:Uncharacterized protein n=1 Tax=Wickerhamomyces mucosus TaxID=1378264 RepID=A0A9P8TCX0_9ASCO|nr:hypothetical protein WICMUC_003502 [Wickerhamomyces mucosus]